MSHEKAKIIAVWGSPHSGKTTFATKLATAIYDNYQATALVEKEIPKLSQCLMDYNIISRPLSNRCRFNPISAYK